MAVTRMIQIVSLRERPDLILTVAQWLWMTFLRHSGHSFESTRLMVEAAVTAERMPQTFVLLADQVPVGTASLTEKDLDERSDLSPWLASVYVEPDARGRGHAGRLVKAVEEAARILGVETLWLFTGSAEDIYARAGWMKAGQVEHSGAEFTLMRRDLTERQPDKPLETQGEALEGADGRVSLE